MRSDTPLVDFHCHLSRCGGVAALESRGQSSFTHVARGPRVVAVTNGVSEWRALSAVSRPNQIVWALGLHPGERHTSTTVAAFMATVAEAEAIGEIGLDFRKGTPTDRTVQIRRLSDVLDAIEGQRKLVTLHSAAASAQVVKCLARRELPAAVLHWFLGREEVIDRAIDLDVFFSVNPSMFRSVRGRTSVEAMPPNRVVLETDAPFAVRNKALPVDIGAELEAALSGLVRIWRLPQEEARQQVLSNQQMLLSRSGLQRWTS